jgi:hypothetical protein
VLLGDGHGGFSKTTLLGIDNSGSSVKSVAVGDFNEDGNADLVIANFTTGTTISILFGTGKGSFGSRIDFEAVDYPYTVAVGDFNNDGHADVATASYYSASVSILPGDGKGSLGTTINSSTGSNPYLVTVGDFNHDGIEDLAMLCGNNSVATLTGIGGCRFNSNVGYTVGKNPKNLNICDVNGDGNIDLVTSNFDDNTISILKGLGNGSFAAKTDIATGSNPSFVSTGDFNRDGKADIAVANSGANSVSVLLNISVPATIPNNLPIAGKTISGSEPTCFNAYDSITVAGVSPVTFESGTTVEMIAGKSIRFLPGFYCQSGSYMYSHITSDSTFCDEVAGSSPIVAAPLAESNAIEKSVELPVKTIAEKTVKVYPNPNNGQFTLELSNVESGASVSIYNMLGKMVFSGIIDQSKEEIKVTNAKKGLYVLRVSTDNESFTRKIIIQ